MSSIRVDFVELLTVGELARLLKKKPSTIYSDLVRRPQSLPPVFRAPGSRRPLFVNARSWILANTAGFGVTTPKEQPSLSLPPRKKPGRPTNLERMEHARLKENATAAKEGEK